MITVTKTIMGFKIPDEYQLSVHFGREHPDFRCIPTTEYIYYIKESNYIAELSIGDNNNSNET